MGLSPATETGVRWHAQGMAIRQPPVDLEFVLFDLGGVLIRLGGVSAMRQLAGIESDEELWHRWLTCRWVRSYERGMCSSEEFSAGVVADWDLAITAEEFIEGFRLWPQGLIDGAELLVEAVGRSARVGCISNTNALHASRVAQMGRLMDLFEVRFLSHELGLVKPDRELFDHVSAVLGVAPGRVVLLDDNAANVAQATVAGFIGIQVRGVDEARRALVDLGVLDADGG
jgi:FMN phosphatase YigB (HAD superfamily)